MATATAKRSTAPIRSATRAKTSSPQPVRAVSAPQSARRVDAVPYLKLFLQDPILQIETARLGFPASAVKQIAGDLTIEQSRFLRYLNLKPSTLNRKAARAETLPVDESERVLGLARLVGQVESIVRTSGDPEGFNAAAWLSNWLREPLPAFGGRMPITLLDTMAGQALLSQALSRTQSGAYG